MSARRTFCAAQGLTPTEAAVMDMHDGGASLMAIADATGKAIGAVRKIVHTFGDYNEERRARRAAENGSQLLLIAQLRAGQHQLPAWMAIRRATELVAAGAVRR